MKKIFNIMLLLAALTMYTACHYEIDDVFDQPSAIRIQEEMKRVDDILKGAENGWLMEYYASTTYGGYNVICKFNEDNTVLAQSEIYGPATATSHYKFEQSQGVVLSFDEYNEIIHFFSDPANPAGLGEKGDGMLGDFEFRVLSAESDMVVLSGKKHGAKIVMKPMAADAVWNEYLEKVAAIETSMAAAAYVITAGDKSVIASSSYRQLTYPDEETGTEVKVPYMVTDKGFLLYKEIVFNGKTVNEFIYSAEDGKCYAEGDNTVSLEIRLTPLSEAIQTGHWFLHSSGISESALPYFLAAKEGSAAEGEVIQYMLIGDGSIFGPSYNTGWGIVFVSGRYLGTIYFEPTIVDDDTISLKFIGADSSNGAYYLQFCNYGGLTQVLTGTFDLATDDLKNPGYITLTDTNKPENVITVFPQIISTPFEQ